MSLSEESIDIAFSQILGRVKSGEIDIIIIDEMRAVKSFLNFFMIAFSI